MTSARIVRFRLFPQVGSEDAGGEKNAKIASFIFIFLTPLVQQCERGRLLQKSVDLEVRTILLQLAVVHVHGE